MINERQWVTIGIFSLTGGMLWMAHDNPVLWEVKLFEILIQAIVLTGLLNMVTAFHFSSNQNNENATANTGRAFDAITAAATGVAPSDAPTGTPDDPTSTVIVNPPDDPANVQEQKP